MRFGHRNKFGTFGFILIETQCAKDIRLPPRLATVDHLPMVCGIAAAAFAFAACNCAKAERTGMAAPANVAFRSLTFWEG
jgi:hypothetical protein